MLRSSPLVVALAVAACAAPAAEEPVAAPAHIGGPTDRRPAPYEVPGLAPLASPPPPCTRAAELRDRARQALAADRPRRALRLLDSADRRCAEGAAGGAAIRSEALKKASSDAIAPLERESGQKPEAMWDQGDAAPAALSADGSTALLRLPSTLVVADAATLAFRRLLDVPRGALGASLSRDGALVASIERDGAVEVREAATGRRLQRFVWADEPAKLAVFSSDAKLLVAVADRSRETRVRIWRLDTGDAQDGFVASSDASPSAVALSADGRLLAVGTDRGALELWSLGPPKRIATVANQQSFVASVRSIAFSPKGDKVAAAFRNGEVLIAETKTGKETRKIGAGDRSFDGPDTVLFSADGTRVSATETSSFHTSMHVWDVATGVEVQNRPLEGPAVAVSADGRRVLGVSGEGATTFDVIAGKALARRPVDTRRLESVAFGAPRVLVATLDHEKALRAFSARGPRWLQTDDEPSHVALGLDGSVALSIHSHITVWDLETASVKASLPDVHGFPDDIAIDARGVVRAVETFGGLSVVAHDRAARAWTQEFKRDTRTYVRAALCRHGRSAVVVSDGSVSVLDLVEGRLLPVVSGLGSFESAQISPDGRVLFVAGREQVARFDPRTGSPIGQPVPKRCGLGGTSFDGSRVVTACDDRVEVISFAPRAEVVSIPIVGLERDIRGAVLAPHGDLVAVFDERGTIALISVADRSQRATLRFLPGADAALVTAPDGRVELVGRAAGELAKRMVCRVGGAPLPFDVCADALVEEGLLAEVLGG